MPKHEILGGVTILVFNVFVNYGGDAPYVIESGAASGIIRYSERVTFSYSLERWMFYQLICFDRRCFQQGQSVI
jgi:hypothetical protein